MQLDPSADQTMQAAVHRARSRPWLPVLSALLELGEGKAELISHAERAWASVTFSGTRHTVRLAFDGAEAVAAGERLIEALPEHEFAIPRQLVADATVIGVVHSTLPAPRLAVEVELLLLEDA